MKEKLNEKFGLIGFVLYYIIRISNAVLPITIVLNHFFSDNIILSSILCFMYWIILFVAPIISTPIQIFVEIFGLYLTFVYYDRIMFVIYIIVLLPNIINILLSLGYIKLPERKKVELISSNEKIISDESNSKKNVRYKMILCIVSIVALFSISYSVAFTLVYFDQQEKFRILCGEKESFEKRIEELENSNQFYKESVQSLASKNLELSETIDNQSEALSALYEKYVKLYDEYKKVNQDVP